MNESQISKQHPIPQNFMDVEFKIVGDFTVRQFTYLCLTGLPMYAIFNSPIQSFVKTIILIVLGLLGTLLVFVPIDDRSMDVWIVNFFKSVYAHNRRVWRKTAIIPKTLSMEAIKIVQGEMITLAPTSSRRKLEEYLKGIKEEAPDEFDFNFNQFQYREVPTTLSQVSVQSEETIPQENLFVATEELKVTETTLESLPEIKPEVVEKPKPALEEVVIKMPEISKPKETIKPVTEAIPQQLIKKIVQPIKAMPAAIREVIKPKPKVEKPLDVHEELRTTSADLPGRKFVSFSKKEQDIILPIRGERTIQLGQPAPQQPITANRDIKTLTKELRTLVREIKHNEAPEPIAQPQAPVAETIDNNLSGICFSPTNQPLPNLMLALTDNDGKEIQYTRTDNLGKFSFSNLFLGEFKIKVLNPEIYGLNFDIISLSIKTFPYTFIQILGKK